MTGGTVRTGSRAAAVAAGGSRTTPQSAWREDAYTRALLTGTGPLFLRYQDGRLLPLAVERWLGDADAADESVLLRCRGTVLDIGCGPGRLVAALAGRGHRVLGIDISPAAVARTVLRGGTALCRSVFHPLPGEGRWNTALLLDGNVGIGGDPGALLSRTADVLAPGGRLIVETAAAEVDECCEVRLDGGRGDLGAPFRWAHVGPTALRRHAGRAGWVPARTWRTAGRHFTELRMVRRTPPNAP